MLTIRDLKMTLGGRVLFEEASFGVNYGVLFTAWGVGGLVLPRVQQTLTASSGGSYTSSFITAGVMLIAGGLLTLAIKPPAPKAAAA